MRILSLASQRTGVVFVVSVKTENSKVHPRGQELMIVRDAPVRFEAVDGPPLFEVKTNLCIAPAVLVEVVLIGGTHGVEGHVDVYEVLAFDEVKVGIGRYVSAIIGRVKGVFIAPYKINQELAAPWAGVAVALGAVALGEAAGAKETEKTESALGVQRQDGLPAPSIRVRDALATGVCRKADYIIKLLSV